MNGLITKNRIAQISTGGNRMVSGQSGRKPRMLMALMVVATLWASVAIAGVDEDFVGAAGRGDLTAVKSSMAKGADVNARATVFSATALMLASQNGHKEVVQLLLDKGADVNAKATDGVSALMLASQNGHKVVVQLLLDKGADVNAKATDGKTALVAATEDGHKEVRDLLIRAGAK
jgi:uncharacterized protein